MTFEEYLQTIQAELDKHPETSGLSWEDFPDQPFRDWYEDEVDAESVVERMVFDCSYDGPYY